MAEMYIQGLSTRKVQNLIESTCGFQISAEQVSRAATELDEELEKWRNRPIGCVKALVLDASYEKVRVDGAVVSCAVLVAFGDGRWASNHSWRKRFIK